MNSTAPFQLSDSRLHIAEQNPGDVLSKERRKMGGTVGSLVFPSQTFHYPQRAWKILLLWRVHTSDWNGSDSGVRLVVSGRASPNWPRKTARTPAFPSRRKTKDSGCRCFASPLQLCGEKNMVDGFPPFTEQRNIFLLLICSLHGAFLEEEGSPHRWGHTATYWLSASFTPRNVFQGQSNGDFPDSLFRQIRKHQQSLTY